MALRLPLVNISRSPTRMSSAVPALMSLPVTACAGVDTVAVCPFTLKL